MTIDTIISKTIGYLSIPSVVGHEGFFMRHLARDFQKLDFDVKEGEGILAVRGNRPDCAIVSAHIDRHGLISLGNGEYAYAAQFIKEIKYGQNNRASQTELESISKRFSGENVYAYHPETAERLGDGLIESCEALMASGDSVFQVRDMTPAEQGTPLAYARTAKEENGYLRGQIDNAISLGVLYALCENGFEGTLLLTTEEEIGKSAKHMARWLDGAGIETKELIILDTSPYKSGAVVDEGTVVLRNRDKSEEFNRDMVAKLKSRCEALSIPYEVKDEALLAKGKEIRQLGSTELGKLVSESGGRWSGATVQIPTMLYHTSNETTSRKCIRNYYDLLSNVLIEDRMTA